ncbi:MAG TPA: alpha-L-fucosidase [Tepidisphaeraceae bacterium]|nr:alpha-L-fucosidase [Tepidisphaeraceae bacterium]
MNHRALVSLALSVAVAGCCCANKSSSNKPAATTNADPAPVPSVSQEPRDVRMAWWRAARFGMFIHWGIYSVPAGTYHGQRIGGIGEWIMNNASIPVSEYAGYANQFTADKFDADAWVKLARDAGMNYIVITSKHHDGFAMFHSQVDGYNVYDATPFHRDPLAELAAACHKYGMKLGFYYSQCQDWHHPGGAAIRHGGRSTDHWDPAQDGSFDDYLANVAVPQVREILSNYGPVAVLWFDTPTRLMTPERAALFKPLLALQPDIVVNNRLGGGFKGDTETPEQRIPPNGFPGEDWETCMTINDTWGYKSYDTNFKSTETLLRNLIDIASKGGNYLLNVGPTSEGVIPQPEQDRLLAIGKWLSVNGEAIYGSGPTPFGAEAGSFDPVKKDKNGKPLWDPTWVWRCTTKPGKLYIHIFKWPDDGKFDLTNVRQTVTKAYMLADAQKTPLAVTQDQGNVSVALPPDATDPIASVLCLEVSNGG